MITTYNGVCVSLDFPQNIGPLLQFREPRGQPLYFTITFKLCLPFCRLLDRTRQLLHARYNIFIHSL